MNISVYLNDVIVKRIDREAKKTKVSRSGIIQSILEKELLQKEKTGVFDDVFGILSPKEADDMMNTIYSSRQNSSRFK
ncbi:ribbon-helix-helix domain-containing protein [bacterium]|nr:ribbon-helix-helix domain-containing protein [bacterium]